jgi:hypothetical protein
MKTGMMAAIAALVGIGPDVGKMWGQEDMDRRGRNWRRDIKQKQARWTVRRLNGAWCLPHREGGRR